MIENRFKRNAVQRVIGLFIGHGSEVEIEKHTIHLLHTSGWYWKRLVWLLLIFYLLTDLIKQLLYLFPFIDRRI